MILVILAFWFGYKKAKETGRNPLLWSIAAGVTFIGVQVFIGVMIGLFLGFGIVAFGWSESIFDDYEIVFTIVAAIGSLVVLMQLLKYIATPIAEPTDVNSETRSGDKH